ncbi:Polysaccharide lyase [Bradyrhizobium erythrophlei]|nr:Polysaccharide lyase [Bradyrhizobium erythrophlei]
MALSPNITNFSSANGSRITIDGHTASVQNANDSWSLTEPDSNTLQFSVHSGDHWSTATWSDLTNDNGAERSELSIDPNYAQGTQVNLGYQLTVQPGLANTASWLVLNQMHATTEGPPPFSVQMDGEHMEIALRYKTAGMSSYTTVVAYRDPNPIQRGHAYDMNVQVNFDPNGNGYLNVWRDGVQIVKYQGAIGMAGATYYWKEGVYRAPAPETITASYSNLDITTGSAPPPTTPTAPTTPTTPTVSPAVTQATASPGTGTEHVGDTITLALGFNEAVTVSGTPTLSLNDGGTASYVSGSGTGTLTFRTTVASTDTNTSALAITGVHLANGASIRDASGAAANLAGAVKTFSGLQVATSSTSPSAPSTPPSTPSPNITNFSSANGSRIIIDGHTASVQNANDSWSLTEPDSNTLQFSVHSGDHWSTATWSDLTNDNGAERSELSIDPNYAQGTQVNLGYQLTVQPGLANTASWLVLNQMHATTEGPPPFSVQMDGEHMEIALRYKTAGMSSYTTVVAYRDPNPIQRGHAYDMNVQVNFDPNGNGYLNVWRDGVQIVKYQGAIGMAGATYYWKEGVYRAPAPETITASYSNLDITTGSAPPPTTPTAPTTPTTPTVSPAVTQATASPGTGTEHVGDTITLALGFNEAVTVSGTPTLSLNDGGTASYVSGSGTGTLTFRTTVASTDTNTSALAITGVHLANGASIRDASGAAANLAGAVKTFSGLQVATSSTSPSAPSTPPSTPSTPSSIAPVLTVADSTLSVAGDGGKVDLGVNVTTTDPNDAVTVNIAGLPKYETITDKLDGQTFRGNNVTMTAAEVDSGLVLQSNYRGGGHPVATLTLTAAGKDPSTGAVTTSASQTITVTDPRPATATITTSPQTTTVTNPAPATDTTTASPQTITVTPATDTTTAFPAGKGFGWLGQHEDQAASTVATTEPEAITAKNPWPATIGSLANDGFALLQQHLDRVTGAAPISVPQTIPETDSAPATGKAMASLASQSFALLNQYLAGNTGRVDPGQIVAAVSQGAGWGQDSLLTRPQH